MAWLDKFPWILLLALAVYMGLAPFAPEPHLVQKIRMLAEGELSRTIDIFDLAMHATPVVLVILKLVRMSQLRRGS